MSRVEILNDKRITASLHYATGSITKVNEPAVPTDSWRQRRRPKKQFWIQFDEPQRGAGSVMTGVWLEEDMFRAVYVYRPMTADELRQEAENENSMMNGED